MEWRERGGGAERRAGGVATSEEFFLFYISPLNFAKIYCTEKICKNILSRS
jgi:hypothetical protein